MTEPTTKTNPKSSHPRHRNDYSWQAPGTLLQTLISIEREQGEIVASLKFLDQKIDDKFNTLDQKINVVDKRVDASKHEMDIRFDKVDARFDKVEASIVNLSKTVSTLSYRLFGFGVGFAVFIAMINLMPAIKNLVNMFS